MENDFGIFHQNIVFILSSSITSVKTADAEDIMLLLHG